MNKPQRSSLLNICIFPDEHVSTACVEISRSLESAHTMFTLDGISLFAHMTVYMARFPEDALDEVIHGVEAALLPMQSFQCQMTGYAMTGGGYLEVSYRKSAACVRLHESIMRHIAGFRLNPGKPYIESFFGSYTMEQQRNAREVGYDLAHELYRPHITLTRYHESEIPEKLPTLPDDDLSFSLSKIGIYKADDNGAVYERLHEFHIA